MKTYQPPRVRILDVRAAIAAGDSPFETVMTSAAALGPQETLLLITPFMPAPLIEKLRSEGFEGRPERRRDGSWETQFKRI